MDTEMAGLFTKKNRQGSGKKNHGKLSEVQKAGFLFVCQDDDTAEMERFSRTSGAFFSSLTGFSIILVVLS
ncbi:MAG: hypothetical protein LBI68_08355 [Azoarcus sp.]|nr:hypothetical protein [Azoarcus sp.]